MKKINSFAIMLTCIFLDRITKLWALRACLIPYVITPWCQGELAINKGIAWSIGAHAAPNLVTGITLGVTALTLAIGTYLLVYYKGTMSLACALVLAGAVGNVVDRWLYGGVVDFIVLHYNGWYFPTFNVADVAICCGALWWFLQENSIRNPRSP